nr:insecticidal delta-endotoxin Cry8Ea1 family protein [Bacillus thuringiensis]
MVGAALGTIPYAGDILALLVEIFWPEDGQENYSDLINALMEQVELLIDEKISEQVRNDALATLTSSGIALQSYLSALEDWKIHPNNARSAQLVRERFTTAEAQVRSNIAYVSRARYEILLLPIYAQVANIHLLLLRQVELYGKDLGYSQSDIDLFYNEQQKFLAQYTNYCTNWYNTGLNTIWNNVENLVNSAQYWDQFNDFRRELTLTVLDIVSTFPTYDARLYPPSVKGELTREVYTRSINANYFNQVQAGAIEEAEIGLTNAPRLFPLLKKLELLTNITFDSRWKFLTDSRSGFSYTSHPDIRYNEYEGYYLENAAREEISILPLSTSPNPAYEKIYKITAECFHEERYIP